MSWEEKLRTLEELWDFITADEEHPPAGLAAPIRRSEQTGKT